MNLRSGVENLHVIAFWLVFIGGLGLGLFVKGWVSAKEQPEQTKKRQESKRR